MSADIFFTTILLTISGLLPIANPFSTAPLFISLTAGFDANERNKQALMGCIYAFGILVVFLLLGSFIIRFFSISVPGIRVAGGLIISTIGFRMLFPSPQAGAVREANAETDMKTDVAFTPIAMPSLAGPGSISVVLSGASQIRAEYQDTYGIVYISVVIGMAITLGIAFVVLRASSSMVHYLGRSGIDAMTRIFGFLLICMGMQFLLTGIDDFFQILPHTAG